MANYLVYWKLTAEQRRQILKVPRTYAGGRQLKKLKRGDVLWIINLNKKRLHLIGHLQVGEIVNSEEQAKKILNTDKPLWSARHYAIAEKDTAEYMKWINIDQVALKLRFISSSGSDRLSRKNGLYEPMELRAIRQLTPQSARLLQQEWYGNRSTDTVLDYLELTEDDREYAEGRLVARTRLQRVRNRELVSNAKTLFKEKYGKLYCEVCKFSFEDKYGIDDYIEAHHVVPIGDLEGEVNNQVENLIMLCANCHRALHHTAFKNNIDELRKYIEERKS